MENIEKLSVEISSFRLFKKMNDTLDILKDLLYLYPDIIQWYNNKVIPKINSGERTIIKISNKEKVIGILIVDLLENKICTWYVRKEFQNKGYGSLLLNIGLSILKTKEPYFYFYEENLKYFKPFITKYNWKINKENNIIFCNKRY